MGEVVVDEGRVLGAHPSKLLLDGLEFLVRHVIKRDQAGPSALNAPQQLVEFEAHNASLAVLGVLDQKHHQEGNDRCPGVDDELPGIGVVEVGPGQSPDHDDNERGEKSPMQAHSVCGPLRKSTECLFHAATPHGTLSYWKAQV